MAYHYGCTTLEELAAKCPGMQYLRDRIAAIARDNDCQIAVNDGEEWSKYPNTQAGIKAAAQAAVDIDGVVRFRFILKDGKGASIYALYDGPYDQDNREEIINDYTTNLNEYLSEDA